LPSAPQIFSPSVEHPLDVLFLCAGNSARSILAEALLASFSGGKFQAYSAGTNPAEAPHPDVLALLKAKSHSVDGLTSKTLDVFYAQNAPKMDFVFTVCDQAANEECPSWPGYPMNAHWGLRDPVSETVAIKDVPRAIEQTYDVLKKRLQTFVDLPFGSFTPQSLQHHLDDLGQQNV